MKRILQKIQGKDRDGGKHKQSSKKSRKSSSYATYISTTYSHDETKMLLAQPVSTLSAEVTDQIQMIPRQYCEICCDWKPSKTLPNVNTLIGSPDWKLTGFRAEMHKWSHHIMIENTEDLLETARGGCIYCKIIIMSLDRFRPQWKTEKCYMNISLGENAPVLVQLGFGLLCTTPGYGAMGPSTGFALGGTRVFDTAHLVPNWDELPVELTIFRKDIERSQLTLGGKFPSYLQWK